MSQIDELERRITQALDRIAQGVEGMGTGSAGSDAAASGGDAAEIEALRAALEDEKIANAQLEERVKALHARQDDGKAAELSEQLAAQREGMSHLDAELQRLRRANDMLRQTNQDMRRALEANVGEPHLINKAMLAELEGIRAVRAAEAAEAQAVLSALTPLLAQAGVDDAETAQGGV